jgi:hypothetical protein
MTLRMIGKLDTKSTIAVQSAFCEGSAGILPAVGASFNHGVFRYCLKLKTDTKPEVFKLLIDSSELLRKCQVARHDRKTACQQTLGTFLYQVFRQQKHHYRRGVAARLWSGVGSSVCARRRRLIGSA